MQQKKLHKQINSAKKGGKKEREYIIISCWESAQKNTLEHNKKGEGAPYEKTPGPKEKERKKEGW